MSGIYIPGMKMPKDCRECPFFGYNAEDDFVCLIQGGEDTCRLEELPPHGRLIDADALIDVIERTDWFHQAPNKEMVLGANSAEHQAWHKEQDVYRAVEDAPTIIPADPEGGADG